MSKVPVAPVGQMTVREICECLCLLHDNPGDTLTIVKTFKSAELIKPKHWMTGFYVADEVDLWEYITSNEKFAKKLEKYRIRSMQELRETVDQRAGENAGDRKAFYILEARESKEWEIEDTYYMHPEHQDRLR